MVILKAKFSSTLLELQGHKANHIIPSYCHLPISRRSLVFRYDTLGKFKPQIKKYNEDYKINESVFKEINVTPIIEKKLKITYNISVRYDGYLATRRSFLFWDNVCSNN